MYKKILYAVITVIIITFLFACDTKTEGDKNTEKYYEYHNDKGIGFFYPGKMERLSGIAKIYGLAYIGEGWDEEDKGVGKVIVNFGDKKEMIARTYVKDRYWIRTFDTSEFKDGPLKITVTAYDKSGNLIGTAANVVLIDNSNSTVLRRIYVSPNGKSQNKGTIDSPLDINTGIDNLKPGDVLFLREGVYKDNIVLQTSGTSEHPITIMNFPGERVELKEANIRIGLGVEYLNILGIDQGGLRQLASGVELGDSAKYIEFWDCSFNDNTHPYEQSKENVDLSYGTGFLSDITRTDSPEGNRKFITISHCEAKYNDVDGFNLSSIDHGRFQFLESAWNPNHKNKNIFQYKHANGFVNKNSSYQHWGVDSEDNVYLFCYAHHNGQDGWDLRSPHGYLFGCVSSNTAQAGNDFGGVGMKFWEYDYKVFSSVNFRNNLIDHTGGGMIIGKKTDGYINRYTFIYNTVFYETPEYAIVYPENSGYIFAKNDIFMDYYGIEDSPLLTKNTIFYGKGGVPSIGQNIINKNPEFINPKVGNFFFKEDSPALTNGNTDGMTFFVDGIDYCKYDGLGRPRYSNKEIGAYTFYSEK